MMTKSVNILRFQKHSYLFAKLSRYKEVNPGSVDYKQTFFTDMEQATEMPVQRLSTLETYNQQS